MTVLNLEINLRNSYKLLEKKDEQSLSFIVTKVFDEYLEEKNDFILSEGIKNSKELDNVINQIKF